MRRQPRSAPAGQTSTAAGGSDVAYRPPYLAAGIAGACVLLLYAVTLARTTQFWDASEYIATAHILGIPHPPGNPLFVVFARAWDLLLAPTGLSVAVRINLFSAMMGALAHACWFLVAHRILAFYDDDARFRVVGAAVAVLISATAFTVWNHSNVNEKVYTVSLFTIALLVWLAFRWRDNLGRGKDDNLILLMVFILALSVGNHLMAFLAAPALILMILQVAPRTLLNWRLHAAAVVMIVLGLSIHLFLPLRASLDPVINEADPSTLQALWESLTRQQYAKPSVLLDPIAYPYQEVPRSIGLVVAQIGNYLQYFDWQWARSIAGPDPTFGGLRPVFTAIFTALGVFGAWTHYRRDRTSWACIAALFMVLSLGLVGYLNFKYGYSYPVDVGHEAREVRERDYFFIVGFSVWGVWAGLGLAALWQRLAGVVAARAKTDATGRGRLPPLLRASPVLGVALVPLVLNWSWASRSHDFAARDWAYNLLMSVEPYGVLFTNGDNDTFPLWYAQEVEGVRRDVTVIVGSYLNTDWYARQLRDLTTPCPPGVDPDSDPTRIICQRPYVQERGPALYSVATAGEDSAAGGMESATPSMARAPTRTILPLDDVEIAAIAGAGAQLRTEPLILELGTVEATIPGGTVLTPSDIFMAFIIGAALGDRPVYFASTTDVYERFGLQDYLVRQGVAYKLQGERIDPARMPGIVELPQQMHGAIGRYIDLPRTEALLTEVFQHSNGIPDEWTRWVDAATQGIPWYYSYTHLGAAQAYALLGDVAASSRHLERAEAWRRLASFGDE